MLILVDVNKEGMCKWIKRKTYLSGAFAKFTPLLAEELFQNAAVFDGGDASPTQRDAYGHSSTPLPLQQHRQSPAKSQSGVLSRRASVKSSTKVRSNCSVSLKILLSRLASNRLNARWVNLITESLENRSGSLVQWQEYRTSSERTSHRKKV